MKDAPDMPAPPKHHRLRVSLTSEGVIVRLYRRRWWGGWKRTGKYCHVNLKRAIYRAAESALEA